MVLIGGAEIDKRLSFGHLTAEPLASLRSQLTPFQFSYPSIEDGKRILERSHTPIAMPVSAVRRRRGFVD
jgi:hypothetical protein